MSTERMQVPFLSFAAVNRKIRTQALVAFENFFDEGSYILGQGLEEFEKSFAAFCGVSHCVGTGNGLDALLLSLKALGVGQGDEVIIPSNTFVASALAVAHTGATPVLAEPDPSSYNITGAAIAPLITKNTRAVMPVHLFGQACEMNGIMQVADEHNLLVVEDNAQAQGAAFNGQRTGSFGAAAATSFYPGKNLGAYGDAGAVTTNDSDAARRIRMLRNYGSEKKYYHEEAGFNMRMDELQAILLQLKLAHLEGWNAERQRIAAQYAGLLAGLEEIVLPSTAPGATHVFHLFVVRVRHRDRLQEYLRQKGIGTLVHYPVPLHRQRALSRFSFGSRLELTERLASEILSLPLWPGMTSSQVERVASAIRSFYNK